MSESTAGKANIPTAPDPEPVLGLRENLAQFSLLVLVNAFVGGMVGLERVILPLIAEQEFGLVSARSSSRLSSVSASSRPSPTSRGPVADRIGRKPLLVGGWLVGLPVPLLLM